MSKKEIETKMRAWIARDDYDTQIYTKNPEYLEHAGMFNGQMLSIKDLIKYLAPDIKEGECKQFEIIFREVKD